MVKSSASIVLAHRGPALLDVMTSPQELAMPAQDDFRASLWIRFVHAQGSAQQVR